MDTIDQTLGARCQLDGLDATGLTVVCNLLLGLDCPDYHAAMPDCGLATDSA